MIYIFPCLIFSSNVEATLSSKMFLASTASWIFVLLEFVHMSTIETNCKIVIVSQTTNSKDVDGCGDSLNPCRSIKQALEDIEPKKNITILLDGGKDVNTPFHYNILEPLDVRSILTIQNFSQVIPVITSTTEKYNFNSPIFSVFSSRITLVGLSFDTVNVLFTAKTYLLEVVVQKCRFKKMRSIQSKTKSPSNLSISILNSYFTNFDLAFESFRNQNSILRIDASTFIGESNEANRQLHLRNVSIPLRQIGFRSTVKVVTLTSSLLVNFTIGFRFIVDTMFIANSTFTSNGNTIKDYELIHDFIHVKKTLHIHNSTFTNNTSRRGGTLNIGGRGSVFITQSMFVDNTAIEGGGLKISSNFAQLVSCKFIRNVAANVGGALALSNVVTMYIRECEFLNNSVQTISNLRNNHMSKGAGGAISIYGPLSLTVENCIFFGNTAPSFGGSIFYKKISDSQNNRFRSKLINSSFTGSCLNASLVGSLVYISGTSLNIDRVTLHAQAIKKFQSIFYYVNGCKNSIKSLKIYCPSSYDLFHDEIKQSPTIYTNYYQSMLYYCSSCAKGTYSLNGSHRIINNTDVISQKQIKCYPCPNGGSCENGLVSSDNFWGFVNSKREVTFTHCPLQYCCSAYGQKCTSYQTCELNRKGRLCGKCAIGYAESIISTKCVKNKYCGSLHIWIVIVVGTLFYTIFILYLDEITRLFKVFFSAGMHMFRLLTGTKNDDCKREGENGAYAEEEVDKSIGLGIFKIFIFFYQVEFLLQVKSAFKKNYKISLFWTNLISSIFNLKPSSFDSSFHLCAWKDMDAVEKEVLKISVIVVIFVFLSMLYIFIIGYQKILLYSRRCTLDEVEDFSYSERLIDDSSLGNVKKLRKNTKFILRVKYALLRFVLLTYIPITTFVLKLINCIHMESSWYLYINGEIQCYRKWWQMVAILFLLLWLIPFFISLFISVDLLKQGCIGLQQFSKTFIFPPISFYYWFKIRCLGNKTVRVSTDGIDRKRLLNIFSASYKPESEKWIGLAVLRKFMLTAASIFTTNPVLRLYILILLLAIFLILQIRIKPYKSDQLNFCESVSLILLILFAAINLYWAHSYALYVNEKSTLYNLGEIFLYIEYVVLAVPVLIFTVLFMFTLVIYMYQKTLKKCILKKEKV